MSFVRRLADALIDKSTKKSRGIAIGITGAWGSGKSSVLNLLCQHVKDNYVAKTRPTFETKKPCVQRWTALYGSVTILFYGLVRCARHQITALSLSFGGHFCDF